MPNQITIRTKNGDLIADFNILEDYDSLEFIANRIIKITSGKIISKIDGPDSRVWVLNCRGCEFTLVNNPYGNYIKATTLDAKKLLHNIIEQW